MEGGGRHSGGFRVGSGAKCWDFLFPVLALIIPCKPKITLKIRTRRWGGGGVLSLGEARQSPYLNTKPLARGHAASPCTRRKLIRHSV